MQTTHAPNTDPLPTCPSSCIRSTRKPARWNPYACGSRSAPPTVKRNSFHSSSTPEYTLPLSPRLTPESGPSTGHKSAPTIEEVPDESQDVKQAEESYEKDSDSKNHKKYEYTDDFIDVMLGILSLIYCSPLLIAGGRTFVVPQNFANQPPPLTSATQTSAALTLTHPHQIAKPNHMRWFVERLLERTRPPRAVCQLAVAYLVSLTDAVQTELRAAAETRLRQTHGQSHQHLSVTGGGVGAGMPTYSLSAMRTRTPDNNLPPPYSALPAPLPVTLITPSTSIGMPPIQISSTPAPGTPAHSSALLDPRRVMLAAMVLAHKFHLDKTWTNKAWSKISGLTPIEVGRCERTVAIALGHRLWAGRA